MSHHQHLHRHHPRFHPIIGLKFDSGIQTEHTVSPGAITTTWCSDWMRFLAWVSNGITTDNGRHGVRLSVPYPLPQSEGGSFFGLMSDTTSAPFTGDECTWSTCTFPRQSHAWFLYNGQARDIREAPGSGSVGTNGHSSVRANGASWLDKTFELRIATSGCPNSMSHCVQYALDGTVLYTSQLAPAFPLYVAFTCDNGTPQYNGINFLTNADKASW